MNAAAPLLLDHLVLPVAELATARARLSALGFTVAPDGIHPFGTANCCVFLSDGAYLEPLAVIDRPVAGAAISAGNVFVARDATFRQKVGQEGCSAVVLSTSDARACDDAFVGLGVSAGDMLAFSRDFVDPAGQSTTASFSLAFAARTASSPSFVFACERVNPPPADRSLLERHANGAVRLAGVIVSSTDEAADAAFLAAVSQGEAVQRSDVVWRVAVGEARLDVMCPSALALTYGLDVAHAPELRYAAVVLGVDRLGAAEDHFRCNAVSYIALNGRLVVPPAPGQGAAFVFEEKP